MSVRKSVLWSFSGQGLASVISFASTIVLARLLTPQEFGIYGIAIAAQGILQIFAALGLGHYIVRHSYLQPTDLESVFTINGCILILLSAFMLALSFGAKWLLGDAGAGQVLRILAIGPLISILTCRPAAMLQRNMAFGIISVIATLNVLVISLVTLTSAWFGASYSSAAYGLLSGTVFQAAAYNIVGAQHVSLKLGFTNWRKILRFGITMISMQGVTTVANRLSDIALGRLLGLGELGLYGRAAGIAMIIQENVYGTATKISFVKLAQDARQGLPLHPTFLRTLHLILGVLGPIQVGLAILARPVVYHVYGAQWLPSALPLSLLMIAQFIAMMVGMNWELFTIRDEMGRQARLETIRSLIGLGLFAGAVSFGLWAAAAARIAEAVIGVVLYRGHVRRLAGTAPGQIARVYRENALLTCCATMPALTLMIWNGWAVTTPFVAMAGAIALGIAFWGVALGVLHHPLFEETMTFFAAARRRFSLNVR